MKKLAGTLSVALLTTSQSAFAEVSETQMRLCKDLADLARTAETAHQRGVPLSKMLDASTDLAPGAGTSEMFVGLLRLAYNQPRYSTEENKQIAIAEFENSMLLGCLNSSG